MISKWRVPFTPGLIPKRKDEIAHSLGRIVGDYLVTSEGLMSVLASDMLQQKLTAKLRYELIERPTFEQTIEEILHRLLGEESKEKLIQKISQESDDWFRTAFYAWWESNQLDERPLGELLQRITDEKVEEVSDYIAGWLLQQLKEELTAPQSGRLIENMLSELFDRSGWFGAFAGLMTDTGKLANRIQNVLIEHLQSGKIERIVQERIVLKWKEWSGYTLSEWIAPVAGQEGKQWIYTQLKWILGTEQWLQKALSTKVGSLFPNGKEWLDERLPAVSRWVLDRVIGQVEQVVQALELPKLVEREVSRFPIERIEQIVLGVSGKEFRAITWLGALLGGMIGLLQAIIFLFFVQ